MRSPIIASIALSLACSSAAPATGHVGPCMPRSAGTFLFHFMTRSGDCGDQQDALVMLSPGAMDPNCMGTSTESADHCTVTADTACHFTYPDPLVFGGIGSGMRRDLTTITWDPAGNSASGSEQATIADNSGTCHGTYDITISRR